ncbi:MAG: LemA family protein [Clostridia bacterium]|nr:LemA family protein [Clostridia bacterium]
MTIIICVVAIVVLIAIYLMIQYNSYVKLNNMVKEAFSTMDVYLKKRWDLVPNLVESVKGYMKHENDVLEEIVKLRNSSYDNMSVSDKIDSNEKIASGISKIMAISENYPDLKASQNFTDLTNQLASIESDIANSRKYYNGTVRKFNTKAEMFPSNIVAKIFGFNAYKMFEANAEEKENVKVEF